MLSYSNCSDGMRAILILCVFIAGLAPGAIASTYDPKTLNGPGCRCKTQTSNNDIMLLIDTSKGMSLGLDAAVATAATALDVKKSGDGNLDSTTRLGVITYASNVTLLNPLGSMDNDDLSGLFSLIASPSDQKTNLADALTMAIRELTGPNHRNTSRPLIMVMSSVFNGDKDPTPISFEFRNSGRGVVIVWDFYINYMDQTLRNVASPGYFMTNQNQHDGDLQQAICDANCYCPPMMTPFAPDTENPRGLPTAGCYYFSRAQSNRRFAEAYCQNFKTDVNGNTVLNGTLATDRAPGKTAFLLQLVKSTGSTQLQQVIGLYYDTILAQYVWDDGQALDCSDYCPWFNGIPPDPVNNGNSVFLYPNAGGSSTGIWQATSDNKGAIYTCEYEPCDSATFCDLHLF